MRFLISRFGALLLLLPILLSVLVSCKENTDFLSWNKERLVFIGEYEEDGTVFRARFTLDGRDDVKAEMLAPDAVSGITYIKTGDAISAVYGELSLALAAPPSAIAHALLVFPEEPLLESVVKEGAVKTETLRAKGGVYQIRYAKDGLPEEILCLSDGVQKSLYIVSFIEKDDAEKQAP